MLKNYTKYLLMGGEGFIASTLKDWVNANGKVYKILDIKSGGDIRDEFIVGHAILEFEPDIIINLASTAGIDKVANDPIGCIETNVIGVRNILKYKGGIKLVYFSTSEVYGECADRNTEEDVLRVGSPISPRWSYQASKVCAEHLIINSDPKALIVRPFNVFGERQIGHGAIANFIDLAKKGENLKIYGDGEQVRSWCYVDEFVSGLLELIDKDCSGIYNVGNPEFPITIKELAMRIIEICNTKSKLYFVPKREVDVYYRVPNIGKIKKDTGWNPTMNFYEALERTIRLRICV